MTESYPLQWPLGRPRTSYPARSKFGERSIEAAQNKLRSEIRLLRGGNMILSTNLRLRLDGLPYSKQAQPSDSGVAVYFTRDGKQMCFACDRWDRIQDNIYAIAQTIEALRGIERWGTGSMVEQAFAGFTALPASKAKRKWWETLNCSSHAPTDAVQMQYRIFSKKYHPDIPGGDANAMAELNAAYDEFKRERGLS